jgi:multidrug efflux system outer membrane protein
MRFHDHGRVARLTGAFVTLALLAGCALGPDYKRPGGLAPASYRQPPAIAGQAPKVSLSATPLGEMPWWEVFKDPQLQKLIRQALENNQDLKIAIARVEQAHAALGSAQAEQLPSVTANGSATRLSQSSALWYPLLGSKRYNEYAALLDLSYEVDLWGRVRRSKEAARDALLSTDAARRTVVSTLVTGVAQAYFTLLELDSETRITSDTLRTRQETLKLMELRRKHGVASDLEVSQFLAEVAATQAALSAQQEAAFQAENALSILLGEQPGSIPRGISFRQQPIIPNVPVGLPSDLLNRRPDVVQAEQDLAAATARIGVAKAAFFPTIKLTGEAGFESLEFRNLLDKHNGMWTIAGSLSEPIFDGGSNWFNLKSKKALREQALQNYRKVILQALREVSDELVARQESAEQRLHRDAQVRALRDAVRLSDLNYRAGQSSYLDLLDAERQLFAAQVQLEQARLSELLSCVGLYKSLGGGVQIKPALAAKPAPTAKTSQR